jgi:hypothetical protein
MSLVDGRFFGAAGAIRSWGDIARLCIDNKAVALGLLYPGDLSTLKHKPPPVGLCPWLVSLIDVCNSRGRVREGCRVVRGRGL